MAEHLLHFGIITWEDISYTFEASGHLPAGIFNRPLTLMQEAWEGLQDAEVLNKQSVNSLIGIMAIDQAKIFKHNCSIDSSDMPEDATLQSIVSAGDKLLYNFVTVIKNVK